MLGGFIGEDGVVLALQQTPDELCMSRLRAQHGAAMASLAVCKSGNNCDVLNCIAGYNHYGDGNGRFHIAVTPSSATFPVLVVRLQSGCCATHVILLQCWQSALGAVCFCLL